MSRAGSPCWAWADTFSRAVWTLEVSRSGRYAASGHIDFSREGRGQRGGVIVWDLEARRAIGRYEASIPASMVAFSLDEEMLLVGGSRAAKVIRRAGGEIVRQFPISIISKAYAGTFSPDGERVVLFETTLGGPDDEPEPSTKVWELRTGKVLRAFPRRATAFARGARLAIGSTGPLWSVVTGRDESARQLPRGSHWNVRALTDDGGLAFVSSPIEGRDAAGLWDPVSGGEVRRLTGHKERVVAGAITGDGKLVVTGSGSKSGGWRDCTVRVWDASTARELSTLGRHEAGVSALGVSRDGRRVVSGDERGGVYLWDVDIWPPGKCESAAQHCVAVGRTRRSLRSHSRPPLNVSIVGRTRTMRATVLIGEVVMARAAGSTDAADLEANAILEVAFDHHSQGSHRALEVSSRHASVADLMPVLQRGLRLRRPHGGQATNRCGRMWPMRCASEPRH